MKKILTVNPPITVSKNFIDYPFFCNLGFLQNVALIKDKNPFVLDCFALKNSDLYASDKNHFLLGIQNEEFLKNIKKFHFDIIIINNSPFLNLQADNIDFRKLLETIREENPEAIVIIADCYFEGMHYIDYSAEDLLHKYSEIDFIIKYDSEIELKRLIDDIIENNIKHSSIASVRLKDRIIEGKLSKINLDELPFAGWDLINVNNYYTFLKKISKKLNRKFLFKLDTETLPFISSRGCPYKCIFCSNNPGEREAGIYKKFPTDYLNEYLQYLKAKFCVKNLVILDSVANIDRTHFEELLKILNENNLKYDFPNGLRADRLERKHLFIMKEKINTFSVSAESGVQKVIDEIIKKKQSLVSIEKVASWCRELKIPLLVHYVIGILGESYADINATLNHALKMYNEYKALPSIQFAVPIKGTPLYEMCKERNYIKKKEIKDYYPYFSERYLIHSKNIKEKVLKEFISNFYLRLQLEKTKKLIINLTYNCNNNCIICAVGDRKKTDGDYKAYCMLLKRYYDKGVRLVDFDGGEPTLFPEIFKIIQYAVNLGYQRVNITTNGRKLSSRDFTARLLLSGITDLLISLYGHTQKIQNLHSRNPDSFNETVKGINNVVRLKPQRISFGINTTITKFNYLYLKNFVEFLLNFNINKLNIQFLTPFGRANSGILPDMDKAIPLLKEVIDEYKNKLNINVINLPFCLMRGYEKYLMGDAQKYGRKMVFVGNEIVNLANYLATKREKIDKCKGCSYAILCGGFYKFEQ